VGRGVSVSSGTGQEFEDFRNKCCWSVSGTAGSGAGVCGGQQEVGQENKGISRKWKRIVMVQLDVAYESEILRRMWSRPLMVSAGSGTGL